MGSYKLPDGRSVSFTNDETLRDVADLWAVIQGEYNGTPSAASDALKQMLGELQAGKPLSGMEWSILVKIQAKYADQLAKFRASTDDELEGYVPVADVDSSRIHESLAAMSPSELNQIRENSKEGPSSYKAKSTTPLDKALSISHLHDSTLHDIAHALQHAKRLDASDVKSDTESIKFNKEHMMNHLLSAHDHATRLGKHLEGAPSNPRVFQSEKATLHGLREADSIDSTERGVPLPSDPTICVDFDGTIHQGPHGLPGSVEGTPIDGAKEALKELSQRFKVVVLTARVDVGAVKEWLKANGMDTYIEEVTNRKPPASAYIDDRATHFTDWKTALKTVNPDVAVKEVPTFGRAVSNVDKATHHARIKESAAPPPPNLRVADINPLISPSHKCGTCDMFYAGTCWGYGNFPTSRQWVCDEWVLDSNYSLKEAQINLVSLAELNL